MYYVYILRTSNNNLYIGQTSNLEQRLVEHKQTKGAKFLRDSGSSFKVVYAETYPTLLEAMRREKQLKGWTREKKEALIAGDLALLKRL